MASGTIQIITKSVDYGGGRGAIWLTNNIRWNVSGSTVSFTNEGSSDSAGGSWVLCGENNYHLIMEPQVSYDNGGSWTTLAHLTKPIVSCSSSFSNYTNAVNASNELINQLGSYTLNGTCLLRFLYCTNSAPAPTASLPHAFPDSGYSAATQVPVVIELSYRPGECRHSGSWDSHNRSGGKADIRRNGSWVTMETEAGGHNNPPLIRRNNGWDNQAKIGRGA